MSTGVLRKDATQAYKMDYPLPDNPLLLNDLFAADDLLSWE